MSDDRRDYGPKGTCAPTACALTALIACALYRLRR